MPVFVNVNFASAGNWGATLVRRAVCLAVDKLIPNRGPAVAERFASITLTFTGVRRGIIVRPPIVRARALLFPLRKAIA